MDEREVGEVLDNGRGQDFVPEVNSSNRDLVTIAPAYTEPGPE